MSRTGNLYKKADGIVSITLTALKMKIIKKMKAQNIVKTKIKKTKSKNKK